MRADQIRVVAEAAYTAGCEFGPGAAEHVLDIISGASHHVAAGLLYWDAGTRRHWTLASTGYLPSFLSHVHSAMMDGPVFRRLVRVRIPLRYDDAPFDFRDTEVYRQALGPVGYGDGLSVALFLDGDRYAGMLHMNADSSDGFDDDVRDLVAALAPTLGRLCDPTRHTLDPLDDDFCAQIVTAKEIRPVAGRLMSRVLTDRSEIRRVAAWFLASSAPTLRGLWADGDGSWHQVVLLRIRESLAGRARVVLVGDRPCKLPYGLSPREIDVLTRVTRGASNPKIAAELCVAPRTIATHMEHILAKLGCDGRAAAASRAAREGLVRLDLPEPSF